jgi:hypothetical protein
MAVLFTGCIGRSFHAPGLLDLIELGIHFQQLLGVLSSDALY